MGNVRLSKKAVESSTTFTMRFLDVDLILEIVRLDSQIA
jgi:hypothetical protein